MAQMLGSLTFPRGNQRVPSFQSRPVPVYQSTQPEPMGGRSFSVSLSSLPMKYETNETLKCYKKYDCNKDTTKNTNST